VEDYLAQEELAAAEEKLSEVRRLETYSLLSEVQQKVAEISANLERRRQVARSIREAGEDAKIALERAKVAANQWDFEVADVLLGHVDWVIDHADIASVRERYEEVVAFLNAEKESKEAQLMEATALLEEGGEMVEAEELDEAVAILKALRAKKVYNRVGEFNEKVEQFSEEVDVAIEERRELRLAEKRDEALAKSDEIGELIESARYREAAQKISDARESGHYREFRDFRREIDRYEDELKRVEGRARRLYTRASRAYDDGELELLKALLEELEEKYEHTNLYGEKF